MSETTGDFRGTALRLALAMFVLAAVGTTSAADDPQKLRLDFLNCNCRCGNGIVGAHYYPQATYGASPSCDNTANGECIGGDMGCARWKLLPDGDCVKTCFEGAYGKGSFSPAAVKAVLAGGTGPVVKPLSVSLTFQDRRQPASPDDKPNVLTHAAASGGKPPYTYEWFDGTRATSQKAPNVVWMVSALQARAYKVVVKDSAGTTVEATCDVPEIQVHVTDPPKVWQEPPQPPPTTRKKTPSTTASGPPTPCTMPANFESIFDVGARNQMAGPLLDAGRYFLYIAPAGTADTWKTWKWKRLGPVALDGGKSYQLPESGDLGPRTGAVQRISAGQTDILFLNRAASRTGFAARPASDCGAAPSASSGAMTASLTPAKATVVSNEKIRLRVDVSGGVPPYRYSWSNNGRPDKGTEAALTWTFGAPGTRAIRVVVTDSAGHTADAAGQVEVRAAR